MGKYYIGLDGGSTYLKAALIGNNQVIDTMVRNTGIDNYGTARKLVHELCGNNRITPSDIGYIMATGYSRKVLEVADDDISEITAHAYGVRLTAPKDYRPGMIIDIGGQDSKIIYLDENYAVKNFSMNDKCAAASVGIGCGTCCGSGISAALYGYLTTHAKNIRQSVRALLDFFFGKFLAVVLLCCTASLVGSSIIDDSGRLFGVKSAIIVDAVMLAMGVWFLIGWIREKTGTASCKDYKGCKTEKAEDITEKSHYAALIGMGFGYGISP